MDVNTISVLDASAHGIAVKMSTILFSDSRLGFFIYLERQGSRFLLWNLKCLNQINRLKTTRTNGKGAILVSPKTSQKELTVKAEKQMVKTMG